MTVKVTAIDVTHGRLSDEFGRGAKEHTLDVVATVYAIECLDAGGCWCETLNTEREVIAFLRGLRCRTMMPGGKLEPHPDNRQFALLP
jgi:hypothetical protein